MRTTDITIVGAGIIGLAHAWAAQRRGLSVRIIEENDGTVGASVRNFGHCCITGQTGHFGLLAEQGREQWLAAATDAGFWAQEAGAYVLATGTEEMSVLAEVQAEKGTDKVQLLDATDIQAALGTTETVAVGGAYLPMDLRVDPREAAPRIASWLNKQANVEILYNTRVTGVQDGLVETTRGSFTTGHTIVCVGHELNGVLPGLAEQSGIRECALNMMLVAAPEHFTTHSAILTGTSLLRYDAFAETAAAASLRDRIVAAKPELLSIGANCMFTRRPDGTVLVGDSHVYDRSVQPFLEEATSNLLLREAADYLGVPELKVLQRWQGVYASSDVRPLVVEEVSARVTAVTVATGIGMTISFGLAEENLTQLTSALSAV
ncbi:TIGR03364 family FAD-dependent oxidoreductase [Micrococcoides hystricis]|uniref:TIGR03364 family FAD-dependent oxidoreductase n=1 Tax=Micrococcoides hystricis TaxID=1572761 RepID=A0ABV6P8Y1_9MICC